ncbi:hypothetical protein AVEN_262913-1 [Araneus ventricosus]|uniref:Uncharacterized protein n=1 Tax=Araneus ventricosus TaxID=182803 RepID=A0A4Y2DI91_ARAVE|nr:hypothetical protein AVEN_262913-1 [Araneus ventricosus]
MSRVCTFVHDLLRLSGINPCQINAGAGVQRVYTWVYTSSNMVERTTAVWLTHYIPHEYLLFPPRMISHPTTIASECKMKSICKNTWESCSRETPSTTFSVRFD